MCLFVVTFRPNFCLGTVKCGPCLRYWIFSLSCYDLGLLPIVSLPYSPFWSFTPRRLDEDHFVMLYSDFPVPFVLKLCPSCPAYKTFMCFFFHFLYHALWQSPCMPSHPPRYLTPLPTCFSHRIVIAHWRLSVIFPPDRRFAGRTLRVSHFRPRKRPSCIGLQ